MKRFNRREITKALVRGESCDTCGYGKHDSGNCERDPEFWLSKPRERTCPYWVCEKPPGYKEWDEWWEEHWWWDD